MTNIRTGQTQQTSTQGTGQDDATTDDTTTATDTDARTRQDAGRMGGQMTKEKYGESHYSDIGAKGGRARSDSK